MRSFRTALFLTLSAAAAHAQGVAYRVVPVGTVPGANGTAAAGLNDHDEVVGSAVYSPSVRGWHWSEANGFTLLPAVPGQANHRATDINNEGVIAGDGAYDSGFAWRYENGAYAVLGALPGDGRSIAFGLNEAGEVTGTSWGFQFAIPKKAFRSVPGAALEELVRGEGTAINELGQIAGWAGTFAPMRYTPGVGIEMLPRVPNRDYHYASGINNHGAIVGTATQANGNGAIPYLFDDASGARAIGGFAGSAGAAAVNDHGVVVGNLSSGGSHPWIWDEAQGVRFLDGLVDTASGYDPYTAIRINNRGTILVRAFVSASSSYEPVLLIPLEPAQPGLADCFGTTACPCGEQRLAGCTNSTGTGASLAGSGSASVGADDLSLTASDLRPGVSGLVFAGRTSPRLPFGDGIQCVGGVFRRFAVRAATGGSFDEGPGVASRLSATAGDTVRFQCWYRDPGGPSCGGAGFNLSNAYEVTFVP